MTYTEAKALAQQAAEQAAKALANGTKTPDDFPEMDTYPDPFAYVSNGKIVGTCSYQAVWTSANENGLECEEVVEDAVDFTIPLSTVTR